MTQSEILPAPLSAEAAAQAIADLARRRGLHASLREAQQAWQDVTAQSDAERLAAAWALLFQGHTLETVPLSLLTPAQLPAWVLAPNQVGVLLRLADGARHAEIVWPEAGEAPPAPSAFALVPVPPALAAEKIEVERKQRGPATQAILAAIRQHLPLLLRIGLVSVLVNMITVVSSLFAMQVYDRVVPNSAYATLWVLASGVLIAYIFELLFKLIRLKLMEASAKRIDEALSLYFFEKVMALKLDRRPSRVGSLVAQIRDYEFIKSFFTSSTLFVLADIPFQLFFIAIIAMIGGDVAWVLIGFAPLCLLIGFSVYRPLAAVQREQSDEMTRRQGILFEAVAGAEIIKSQGGESNFGNVWLRSTRETAKRSEKLHLLSAYAQYATYITQQMAYVAVLTVGVYRIGDGELTMGGLIACSILSSRALGNIATVTQLLLQWHHARYALDVLNQVLSCPSDDAAGREGNTSSAPLDLAINELRYAYEGVQVNQLAVPKLSIKAGERIAVLGRNGSGKTTLLKLLAGIATPSGGDVTIAGLDIQNCRPSWLREVIGYLPQEVRLFSGTLRENLTLGLSLPSEERIWEALQKTGLDAMVRRHPLGLNIPIREGGSGLSGGQRQLVGLTRLVLQEPRIWVLDEPSSSLDKEAEERLVLMLRNLPRHHTLIFSSHRPGWLELADRVLILEDGVLKVDVPSERVKAVQNGAVPRPAAAVAAQGAR